MACPAQRLPPRDPRRMIPIGKGGSGQFVCCHLACSVVSRPGAASYVVLLNAP